MVSNSENTINKIITLSYDVYNTLGKGFVEGVYQLSLAFELKKHGYIVEVEKPVRVYYKGCDVGFYKVDILTDSHIIVECKCVSAVTLPHINQTKNYMKATGLSHAVIINFGGVKGVEVKRVFV